MSDFPSRDGDERETTPPVISSQSSPKASFWLRELPYTAVFILAIFGIAYNSYSKQSIVGYWQFLALIICMVCIGSGWPHAHDKRARLHLVWTQALHWLAFLVAMNVVLLPNVQGMMNADATSHCWRWARLRRASISLTRSSVSYGSSPVRAARGFSGSTGGTNDGTGETVTNNWVVAGASASVGAISAL